MTAPDVIQQAREAPLLTRVTATLLDGGHPMHTLVDRRRTDSPGNLVPKRDNGQASEQLVVRPEGDFPVTVTDHDPSGTGQTRTDASSAALLARRLQQHAGERHHVRTAVVGR